jgi:uncharacterized protein
VSDASNAGADRTARPERRRFEPPATEASTEFWEATRQRRLVLPWCVDCDQPFWFPREVCPRCVGSAIEWREASGLGLVYAVTVEHKPVMLPEVFGDRPYAVALVDLDEGVRMMTNMVGLASHSMEPDDVAVGDPVEATWEPLSDGRHLLLFQPRSS